MLMEHENCPCMEDLPAEPGHGPHRGKWKMQILCSLYNNGPTRYNQLKKPWTVCQHSAGQRPAGAGGTGWSTGRSTWRSLSG